MWIATLFFITISVLNQQVHARTVFNSLPNLRSNDASSRAEADISQETEELPNLRGLHEDTQPIPEAIYENSGALGDGRTVGENFNFKDEILFHPQKEPFNIDKRGSIPVSNKIDQKRNFIDSNTVGIVIDPRTRKTVGVLENTMDSFHGWKTNDDGYLDSDNFNTRSDLLNVHSGSDILNAHGFVEHNNLVDVPYPVSKYDSLARGDVRSYKRFDDGYGKTRNLDDSDIPVDFAKVKRNSDTVQNSDKKTDMENDQVNADVKNQDNKNLKTLYEKSDNEKESADQVILKRHDDNQKYQNSDLKSNVVSGGKSDFAGQRLAGIYQQLWNNHKYDADNGALNENEAAIEENLKNVGRLNTMNTDVQFDDRELKKRETQIGLAEDEDMEKDENEIELKKRDTDKEVTAANEHNKIDSARSAKFKDESLHETDEKERSVVTADTTNDRSRLAQPDLSQLYSGVQSSKSDINAGLFSKNSNNMKRSIDENNAAASLKLNTENNWRNKRQDKNSKDQNKVEEDVKELFERRDKRSKTDPNSIAISEFKVIRQPSNEGNDRSKRANDKVTLNDNEILKGFTNSGELKISGNKSPLAMSSDSQQSLNDLSAQNSANKIKRLADDEDRAEYERQIEEQIQAKINAIKEQVKREIAAQKSNKNQFQSTNEASKISQEENIASDRAKRYSNMYAQAEMDSDSDVFSNGDFSGHSRRRRNSDRYPSAPVVRHKRANAVVPYQQSAFLPYRADDDEDDEGNEFDDDGFDDRTSNLMQKRQAPYINPYPKQVNFDEQVNYELNPYGTYRKRDTSRLRDYMPQSNADFDQADDSTGYLFDYAPQAYVRRKRESLRHSALTSNLHGGGALASRAIVRNRNAQLMKGGEFVRAERADSKKHTGGDRSAFADSAEFNDFFGALPQTYQGELTRLKRVKRDGDNGK